MDLDDIFWLGLPLVILIFFLSIATYVDEKDKELCKEKGGVVINESLIGYQCLTKEELQKLRGD